MKFYLIKYDSKLDPFNIRVNTDLWVFFKIWSAYC